MEACDPEVMADDDLQSSLQRAIANGGPDEADEDTAGGGIRERWRVAGKASARRSRTTPPRFVNRFMQRLLGPQ